MNRRRSLFAEDYTILHELGHLVLGHLRPDFAPDELDEWHADLFAQTMLDRMLRRPPRRPSGLERLKAFFGV
ncbi:MAG: ImmA/IrrE family metallo-endopeptidase [Firmicutes bacterium]|nr:ImmA/IrrE family metallo-endopeptidase [Bacillota bacterium]